MLVTKNTYGKSAVMAASTINPEKFNGFGGSSLDRTPKPPKKKNIIQEILKKPLNKDEKSKPKLRSLSPRSKSKIRQKLIAFARIHKKLSFVTLTFANEVADSLAVKILHVFLKNVTKQSKDFQYLWVAEKQTKNEVFINNIHFHLITNKYWKIDKWWQYWLSVQEKHGIVPRDQNYKPSSAFDVKQVNSNNIKGVVNYLTKYVTKNSGEFECQIWNCSRKISRLYTDFYAGIGFIRQLEKMEKENMLGGNLKVIPKEYCNIVLVPLNQKTLHFYNKIDEKNRSIWNSKPCQQKEVSNGL